MPNHQRPFFRSAVAMAMSLILLAPLAGCASNESPVKGLGDSDVANATAVGFGVGVVIAILAQVLIDDQSTANIVSGVAIAGGTATGYVVGNIAANRRAKFESESAFLDDEIQNAQTTIDKKEVELAELEDAVKQTQGEIDALVARKGNNEDVSDEAEELLKKLYAEVKKNEELKQKYVNAIGYIDQEVIAQSEAAADETEDLDAKRKELLAKRDVLESQYNMLHGINLEREKQINVLAQLPEDE